MVCLFLFLLHYQLSPTHPLVFSCLATCSFHPHFRYAFVAVSSTLLPVITLRLCGIVFPRIHRRCLSLRARQSLTPFVFSYFLCACFTRRNVSLISHFVLGAAHFFLHCGIVARFVGAFGVISQVISCHSLGRHSCHRTYRHCARRANCS